MVIKLDIDAESRSALTAISLPRWSTMRSDTVSSRTVLYFEWTVMLTSGGFADPEVPAIAGADGFG